MNAFDAFHGVPDGWLEQRPALSMASASSRPLLHGHRTTMLDLANSTRRPGVRRPRARRLAALVGMLLSSPVWSAGPREEVNAAIDKLLTARSYHASLVSSDGRVQQQLEFEAPGRYRIRTGGEQLVVIGDQLYRQLDGKAVQAPLPQDVLTRWRDPARLAEHADRMEVVVLSEETVAGVQARKFRIQRDPAGEASVLLWVAGTGYPVQILTQETPDGAATLVRYSRFNDAAIDVEPPP
ncbi:hypothetical protein ACFFGH_02010 [Lysobacter korlensis]|uniref:Outer membrane lipoprotein carrier protein LolA n=1 Tax=Lysobacter korlensis TaxID=553636 RepID=A0ABV6RI08_9GAMM